MFKSRKKSACSKEEELLQQIVMALVALSQRVQLLRLASESLTVTGAAQFAARVSSEDQQLTRLHDSPDSVRSQGVANNVCGLEAELAVLRWAPEVVALGRTVRSEDGRTSASVDIVAGGGLWWVEVKAVTPFSLASSTWTEMRAQVVRLTACAHSYHVGGRQPAQLCVFTRGCSEEVWAGA